ncbi:Uncharacterised protein [Yersinia pseudotuberculosis]|nr:hypothetical protein BZ19_2706 [Yersinia pseudotuberculosis str. PA3606]CFQ72820.1 Uncharacterised protein [Yersinia similis]CNI57418.1 Uncharacterised protein [Yersinia pseudotuberculosis]
MNDLSAAHIAEQNMRRFLWGNGPYSIKARLDIPLTI